MDEKLREIASIKLNASLGRRQERLGAAVAEIKSDGVKHGTLHSSVTFQRTEKICVQEIRDQAVEAWSIFRDVIEKLRISPDLALGDEIKSEIRTFIYQSQNELNMLLWGTPGNDLVPIYEKSDIGLITEESLKEVGAEIDLYVAAKSRQTNRRRVDGKILFLTHATADAGIALLLKAEIERRIPGARVFCSSDPTDLPLGTKWSPEIQKALRESRMLIMLCTARSLQRPWVWFECGTFWFEDRKKIPLCLGEIQKGSLPAPLSELQAANGRDDDDLKRLFAIAAKETGLSFDSSSDLRHFADQIQALAVDADRASAASSGWLGAEWNGRYLAYDPTTGRTRASI